MTLVILVLVGLQYLQHFNEIHCFGQLETCNKKIKIHKDLTFLQNIIN